VRPHGSAVILAISLRVSSISQEQEGQEEEEDDLKNGWSMAKDATLRWMDNRGTRSLAAMGTMRPEPFPDSGVIQLIHLRYLAVSCAESMLCYMTLSLICTSPCAIINERGGAPQTP
jgi:hypothetical protein